MEIEGSFVSMALSSASVLSCPSSTVEDHHHLQQMVDSVTGPLLFGDFGCKGFETIELWQRVPQEQVKEHLATCAQHPHQR
jgi:hypothetical protein